MLQKIQRFFRTSVRHKHTVRKEKKRKEKRKSIASADNVNDEMSTLEDERSSILRLNSVHSVIQLEKKGGIQEPLPGYTPVTE